MRRALWQALIGVTFTLCLDAAFRAPRASAEGPLPIKIGYQSTPDWLLVAAREQKFLEKAGLAPTYVKFDAGAPMIEATLRQSIDVASLGSVPFLIGIAQGLDWVMIGINPEGAFSEGLVVGKDSGINTPADLVGKRIGFFKGSTAHYGVMTALRQHGIRLDQVTLVHMSPADQLAALAKKEIDAAMVWEPWMQRMIHEAKGRILETEGDIGIYTNVDGYAVRRDWLRDNRETAVRFLGALLMAKVAVDKDPRVAIDALAQEMGIRKVWAEAIYQDAPPPRIDHWDDPLYAYSLVKGAPMHRRFGYLARFLFDEKLISKELDISDVFDASVIAEAVSAQKQAQ